MDRILCVVQWIGSYVSCTGTHVLEQTVQGARHIRCIVLRNSTDGRWLLQGKSGKSGVARFVQYGDCIGTLLPSSDRAYTSACRTSTEARGRRRAAHALFDAAYPHISSSRTNAVSPKLSRSDLVQSILSERVIALLHFLFVLLCHPSHDSGYCTRWENLLRPRLVPRLLGALPDHRRGSTARCGWNRIR